MGMGLRLLVRKLRLVSLQPSRGASSAAALRRHDWPRARRRARVNLVRSRSIIRCRSSTRCTMEYPKGQAADCSNGSLSHRSGGTAVWCVGEYNIQFPSQPALLISSITSWKGGSGSRGGGISCYSAPPAPYGPAGGSRPRCRSARMSRPTRHVEHPVCRSCCGQKKVLINNKNSFAEERELHRRPRPEMRERAKAVPRTSLEWYAEALRSPP